MKIANADKLKEHFEHVVMVKNFTVPEILTIIDTFSVEINEDSKVVMPRYLGMKHANEMQEFLKKILDLKPIGGTQP